MTADDARFVAQFERALALPGADTWPFDPARIRLFCGGRLRHAKAMQTAREQLKAALTAFTQLGASPWADRARNERQAADLGAVQAGASPGTRLSPQQYEIARLAAVGMTNKHIGQRLHLSPRTVGSHPYQVFPKLGITSRAPLRSAMPCKSPGKQRTQDRRALCLSSRDRRLGRGGTERQNCVGYRATNPTLVTWPGREAPPAVPSVVRPA
ncbi:LuxR C-terminal-related transcriptional regulator [Streptomyces sp. NPDC097610]|uniref:helix-turn-helix transcriptional regulator n=1 Tax=Streptomyces sp. NPDC097610 TaxID=3157227 RepID=UPI0033324B94